MCVGGAVNGGGAVLSESVKKRKMTKIFFTDNIQWSSKNLWKMIAVMQKLIKTTKSKIPGGL